MPYPPNWAEAMAAQPRMPAAVPISFIHMMMLSVRIHS
jgi:hypothetical protein